MEIRFLGKTPLAQIVDCFNEAFSDYIVPLQVEEQQIRRRWLSARVDYGLSYGAFDGDRLVGFMMTGVDRWNGRRTAYNSGTGVIPSYRGQGIVRKLYDKALPNFRENAIEQCLLEVVAGNEKAHRAYSSLGFREKRLLKNYELKKAPATDSSGDLQFRQVFRANWPAYRAMMEYEPSWGNQRAAMAFLGKEVAVWEMYQGEHLLGFFIIKPAGGEVLQFGVQDHADWQAAGRQLFQHAASIKPELQLNNIAGTAERSICILETIGMENTLDLHELELDMNARKKSIWNLWRG
jgi:ribosomal protein S18 acetylase RimI-like enzyme